MNESVSPGGQGQTSSQLPHQSQASQYGYANKVQPAGIPSQSNFPQYQGQTAGHVTPAQGQGHYQHVNQIQGQQQNTFTSLDQTSGAGVNILQPHVVRTATPPVNPAPAQVVTPQVPVGQPAFPTVQLQGQGQVYQGNQPKATDIQPQGVHQTPTFQNVTQSTTNYPQGAPQTPTFTNVPQSGVNYPQGVSPSVTIGTLPVVGTVPVDVKPASQPVKPIISKVCIVILSCFAT